MKQVIVHCRFLLTLTAFCIESALAQAPDGNGSEGETFSYGPKGLQYEAADGNNFLWFGVRLQNRLSTTESTDEIPGEATDRTTETSVNRGRFKLGGHLIRPEFTV